MKHRWSKPLILLVCMGLLLTLWGGAALAEAIAEPCEHAQKLARPKPGTEYPATCVAPGGYTAEWFCKDCGAILGEFNQPDPTGQPNPNAHQFRETELPGECPGAQRVRQKFCTLCGFTETDATGSGHDWQVISVEATTCGEADYSYEECALCQATRNYQYGSTLFTHTFTRNEEVVITEPTCSTPGENWQTCDCGQETRSIFVPTLPHTFDPQVTIEGDCVTKTRTSEICSVCQYEQVISYGGYVHDFVEVDVQPATCTENGVRENRCAICDTLGWSQTIPMLPHSPGPWQSDKTRHWQICDLCGSELSSGVHASGNETADCTADVRCADCGYLLSSGAEHSDFAPCDTGDDATHAIQCVRCSYVSGYEAHAYVAVESDCTVGLVCSVCGHQAAGHAAHALSGWVGLSSSSHRASCTVAGCAYAQTEEHAWTDWAVSHNPTETSAGTESRSCTKCSMAVIRVIPLLTTPASRMVEGTSCAAAGLPCTEREFLLSRAGLLAHVCTVCGNVTVEAFLEDAERRMPVFVTIDDVTVEGVDAEGELLLRAAGLYHEGDEVVDAYFAFAASWEADGRVQELDGPVRVSLPLMVGDAAEGTGLSVPTADFKLVREDVNDATREDVQTEVDFTYADGLLTFEMDCAAIYLLIPA